MTLCYGQAPAADQQAAPPPRSTPAALPNIADLHQLAARIPARELVQHPTLCTDLETLAQTVSHRLPACPAWAFVYHFICLHRTERGQDLDCLREAFLSGAVGRGRPTGVPHAVVCAVYVALRRLFSALPSLVVDNRGTGRTTAEVEADVLDELIDQTGICGVVDQAVADAQRRLPGASKETAKRLQRRIKNFGAYRQVPVDIDREVLRVIIDRYLTTRGSAVSTSSARQRGASRPKRVDWHALTVAQVQAYLAAMGWRFTPRKIEDAVEQLRDRGTLTADGLSLAPIEGVPELVRLNL